MNKQILHYVQETCQDLIRTNEGLKQQIISRVNEFINQPAQRTADVVSSIQILTAQYLTLLQLGEEDHSTKDPNDEHKMITIDKQERKFARFALEELARRSIQKDKPFTIEQLLDLLAPNRMEIL